MADFLLMNSLSHLTFRADMLLAEVKESRSIVMRCHFSDDLTTAGPSWEEAQQGEGRPEDRKGRGELNRGDLPRFLSLSGPAQLDRDLHLTSTQTVPHVENCKHRYFQPPRPRLLTSSAVSF